jgi:hypothetical protein
MNIYNLSRNQQLWGFVCTNILDILLYSLVVGTDNFFSRFYVIANFIGAIWLFFVYMRWYIYRSTESEVLIYCIGELGSIIAIMYNTISQNRAIIIYFYIFHTNLILATVVLYASILYNHLRNFIYHITELFVWDFKYYISDGVCFICYDNMSNQTTVKTKSCRHNHYFHIQCMREYRISYPDKATICLLCQK